MRQEERHRLGEAVRAHIEHRDELAGLGHGGEGVVERVQAGAQRAAD
jgi:hypothetical protein